MKAILKPSLSSFLVLFFFFILLFLGLFAEVFESQTPEVDIAQIYANPIPVDELLHLKTFKIINKQGTFSFENTEMTGALSGPWQMVEPQSLVAKNDVVSKIVEALNVIRVRNFHHLEPINVSSFSLDNPTLSLLFTTKKGKSYEIKMGLINPIDNSAYISLSSQNQIYQIDPLEMALESYDLAQLVESKVLALNPESLLSLEIYGKNGLEVKLLKKDDQWLDQNGLRLNESKVSKFFSRLESIKSFSIIDKLTAAQKEFMEKTVSSPVYTLKLISAQGVRSYVVGEIEGSIPGLNQATQGTYALSSDDRDSFVLINRDQLNVLGTKINELK